MSFNRLKYDLCETKQYVKETVAPGNYYVKQPLICGTSFQANPSIRMQKSGVSLSGSSPWRFYDGPIDVESELRNLSRPASRCPSKQYLPKCSNCGCRYQGQPCGADVSKLCKDCIDGKIKNGKSCGDQDLVDFPDCHFPVEHTRLNDCVPRGVGLNRFDFPCMDPQANLFFPGAIQIPSRLVEKDNYRICRQITKINDMSPQSFSV
jgi:hypothetical protein